MITGPTDYESHEIQLRDLLISYGLVNYLSRN